MAEQQTKHKGAKFLHNEPMFSIKCYNKLITAGTHFWCEACLVARPLGKRSPDERYCQGCYDFLLKEAEMLTGHIKKETWIPRKNGQQNQPYVSQYGGGIKSTLGDKKIGVDIIQPSVVKDTRGKRGPKPKVLPYDLINQWAGEGMGSKAIASKLNNELGIKVSYKTIQRTLAGVREE
jgi:hypothetical protein